MAAAKAGSFFYKERYRTKRKGVKRRVDSLCIRLCVDGKWRPRSSLGAGPRPGRIPLFE